MNPLLIRRRGMMKAQGGASEPDYLRFTALQDSSSVSLNKSGSLQTINIEYRVNGGTWTAYTYNTAISLDTGDYIEMRNADDIVKTQLSEGSSKTRRFSVTGLVSASGNVMSLLDKTCQSTVIGNYCFYSCFYNIQGLTGRFIFPATTVGANAYSYTFYASGQNANLIDNVYIAAISDPANSCFGGWCEIRSIRINTLNTSSGLLGTRTLEELIIDADTPATIASNTLTSLKADCIIYVPDASVNDYKTAQYWSDRANYIKGISERPT